MGLQKTSKDSAFYFMEPIEKVHVTEDTLPDGVSEEEFKLGSRQQIGEYLQQFGWKPKHSLRQGLERTIKWYRENK